MLNLKFIFEDAIKSLNKGSEVLEIHALPMTIYMMQKDVINHYEHAITHYFTLSLDYQHLQNSSMGTPYEKWMIINNGHFGRLIFCTKLLISYSSRLFHESYLKTLRMKSNTYQGDIDRAMESNRYTDIICDFKYKNKQLGLIINENQTIDLGEICPQEREDLSVKYLKTSNIDIKDRRILNEMSERALAEIKVLKELHNNYGELCKDFYSKHEGISNYKNMMQNWFM